MRRGMRRGVPCSCGMLSDRHGPGSASCSRIQCSPETVLVDWTCLLLQIALVCAKAIKDRQLRQAVRCWHAYLEAQTLTTVMLSQTLAPVMLVSDRDSSDTLSSERWGLDLRLASSSSSLRTLADFQGTRPGFAGPIGATLPGYSNQPSPAASIATCDAFPTPGATSPRLVSPSETHAAENHWHSTIERSPIRTERDAVVGDLDAVAI